MATITFKYTNPDVDEILTRAKELGYKEKIMDETQLVDGKIPVVQMTDEAGELRWEMDYTYDEETLMVLTETLRLDDAGEKIPVMGQKDIQIPNPEAPEVFISKKAQAVVADLLAGGVEKQIVDAAKLEAEEIVKTAKATAKATKEAVAASIEVTIE